MLAFFINRIMCTLRSMCKVYLPYHTMSAVCVCIYIISSTLCWCHQHLPTLPPFGHLSFINCCVCQTIEGQNRRFRLRKKDVLQLFRGLGCYKNSKILVIMLSTEVTLTILSLYLIPEYILIISLHYTKACWRDVTKESYEDKRRSSCVHTR